MINASGASGSPIPNQSPANVQPQMPQAGAGIPSASPAPTTPQMPQATTQPTQPLTPSTTPPAAGNTPIGGSSTGGNLKKPKKKIPWKMIAGTIVLVLALVGALAGYFLTQTSQDVRQQASVLYKIADDDEKTTKEIAPKKDTASTNQVCCSFNSGASCSMIENSICSGNGGSTGTGCSCDSASGSGGVEPCPNDLSSGSSRCEDNTTVSCVNGFVSRSTCPNGYSCSSGTCVVDTESDPDSCLIPGNSCPAGQLCTGDGRCVDEEKYQDAISGGSGGSGSSQTLSSAGTAAGSGDCTACLGLGGQAERDCYANCSGTIQTGICAGMTTSQCESACTSSGGDNQICTGSQEEAGTPRAGEFLSCGASSTNGCGQVDCIKDGQLIGFVIDNSQCTATGGTTTTQQATTTQQTTTTTQSTLSPELAACGEGCSVDNNCADANHSCIEGECKLTTNPTSDTCSDPSGTTPSPIPQPSPTPLPTINPELASCNESCSTSADCADLHHSCQDGLCRLTDYPQSDTCTEPSGSSPTPIPRTEDTPLECNDPCSSNSDCSSFNHICYNDRCRLSTNVENLSCNAPNPSPTPESELGQISQQPDAPVTLPSAGSDDLKNWLLTGLGAIGVGALILLLL